MKYRAKKDLFYDARIVRKGDTFDLKEGDTPGDHMEPAEGPRAKEPKPVEPAKPIPRTAPKVPVSNDAN